MSTRDPKHLVLTWRAEIAAELEEAQKLVPPLEAAHAEAGAAIREPDDFYSSLHRLLRAADVAPELAISSRLEEYRAQVVEAKSRKATALADLEAARTVVKNLRRALAQIDFVIPVEDIDQH